MSERKTPFRARPETEVVRRSVAPAPRPAGPSRPSTFGKSRPGISRSMPLRTTPSHPPSEERIQELARKERVPARIAKGELQGQMKCRIWKQLHAEEARRFNQAYALMAQHSDLALEDAFGLLQSARSIESFRERRRLDERRAELQEARRAVPGEAVDRFLTGLIEAKTELSLVLGDRTQVDHLTGVSAGWFQFQRQGRIEKLKVVLLAPRGGWETRQPALQREPKLTNRPAPIIREPDRRPVVDPRPFLALRGQPLQLTLRNGMQLREMVTEVGPYDLLLNSAERGLFVPFHAIVRWAQEH